MSNALKDKFTGTLKIKFWVAIILTFCLLISTCSKNAENQESLSEIPKNANKLVDNQSHDTKMKIPEGYPQSRVEAIEEEEKSLSKIKENVDDLTYRSYISSKRTWNAGQIITVAFNGGTNELRQKIEEAVKEWSDAANIKFDFRNPSQPSLYQEWTAADTTYSGKIRISFDSSGYWSAIGKESIKNTSCDPNPKPRNCYRPNEASMNFQDFVEDLPDDWKSTVLHEFGHALGFFHEHQNPTINCEEEFLWEPDPGYSNRQNEYGEFIPDLQGRRPGIHISLGGPKNFWSTSQINYNIRNFRQEQDVNFSGFDRDSIMAYHLDWWAYKNVDVSTNSGCYGPQNLTLSIQDKVAARRTYPNNSADIQKVINERVKISSKILNLKNLPARLKEEIKENIKAIKNQK